MVPGKQAKVVDVRVRPLGARNWSVAEVVRATSSYPDNLWPAEWSLTAPPNPALANRLEALCRTVRQYSP
jgi:hypothetical protein